MLGRVGAARGWSRRGDTLAGNWPVHMRDVGFTGENASGIPRFAFAAGWWGRGAAAEAGAGAGPAAAEEAGGGG